MKQTSEKIIAAAEERGWINENEILLLKRRRNRGERIQLENPIPVSYDQAQKGFAWLWDKYRTPRGAERKNNPFSNPEEKALEWANMHGPASPSTASTEPETTGMNLFTNLSRRSATYNILSASAKFKGYEHKILFRGCE